MVATAVASPAIELRVPGKPTGKDRPRFDSRTRRTYTTAQTTSAENDIRAAWIAAREPRLPDDTAIEIRIVLVVVRPAGHRRKDGTLSAEGARHPIPRNRKPDVDNALKLACDALNGRAYRDDVLIARATVERMWGEWPETLITLSPIDQPSREDADGSRPADG